MTTSPQQIVQKRKRSVNPQADENFVKALEAVRFGGIGFCKAARMYGVNNRTLWLEYKKRGYPNFRMSIKNRVAKQEFNNTNAEVNEVQQEQQQQQQQQQASNLVTAVKSQEGDSVVCNTSHPVALVTNAFLEGRPVDVMQRARYVDANMVNQQHTVGFQGINFEHV